MTGTPTGALLRIGEVARAVGTTPRTIRYYEEIGLLPEGGVRAVGQHRLYNDADVERLRDVIRLKDLLGVSLDELRELVAAEDARAELRREWHEGPDGIRRCEILLEALGHLERQLALVRRRQAELAALQDDLEARRARLRERMRELEA